MVSELRDTLDRGRALDPVGAHLFMKAYTKLSPEQRRLQFLDPEKVDAVAQAAGPPWSEGVPPQAPLPGVDLVIAGKAFARQVTSAANALQGLDAQPWGALICELVDHHGLLFRPAAKHVHRGICVVIGYAELVADLLRRALRKLGFDDHDNYDGLVELMCGNVDPPAHASERRICTDLTAMGKNSGNARAVRNAEAAAREQAMERLRAQDQERRQANDARRQAESERARQKLEAWWETKEMEKRQAFQRKLAGGIVAAAALAAVAGVTTAVVVRRKKKSRDL